MHFPNEHEMLKSLKQAFEWAGSIRTANDFQSWPRLNHKFKIQAARTLFEHLIEFGARPDARSQYMCVKFRSKSCFEIFRRIITSLMAFSGISVHILLTRTSRLSHYILCTTAYDLTNFEVEIFSILRVLVDNGLLIQEMLFRDLFGIAEHLIRFMSMHNYGSESIRPHVDMSTTGCH